MEKRKNELSSLVEKVFTQENFVLFMKILASNPNMSLENLLFIFRQKPDAKQVCGKNAWLRIGRKINEDSKGIKILIPRYLISAGETEIYQETAVFDLESTSGKDLALCRKGISVGSAITKATGIPWEVCDSWTEQSLGTYDEDNQLFLLSSLCKGDKLTQTELEVCVDYRFRKMEIDNGALKTAIVYTLLERYGISNRLIIFMLNKLRRLSNEEKYDFLNLLVFFVWEIVQMIEGIQLSFQESILVNYYLESIDLQRMRELEPAYKEWGMEKLIDKLENTSEEVIEELLRRRCNRQLFTFPPCNLEELLIERGTRI